MSFLKRFQLSLESLCELPATAKYVVAYSGGVDSHVLLHCCHQLGIPVRAVHVHHGLQAVADDWVSHCLEICDALSIPLEVVYVDATKKPGLSPEETARSVRYEALQKNLRQGDCLITAQHLDDQAETLLLQLFRGSGSAGLAAMPSLKSLGRAWHVRPLLSFARGEIEAYAAENALSWIEDPSNQDVRFDRNFIRKDLLPLLADRWPAITEQLSAVASLQYNNLRVLEDMAAVDLANVTVLVEPEWGESYAYEVISILSIVRMQRLSSARLLNVLRYWIKQTIDKRHGSAGSSKTSPSRNLLVEIEKTLIYSQLDATPIIVFSGYEYRKYQDNLYMLKPGGAESKQRGLDFDTSQPLYLPTLDRQIKVIDSVGKGLKKHLLAERLTVSFRQGGEQFHPVGRQHSQSLKKLFQEANIPPWERDMIPLLYCGDELIVVIGYWISRQHTVAEGEPGWVLKIDDVAEQ